MSKTNQLVILAMFLLGAVFLCACYIKGDETSVETPGHPGVSTPPMPSFSVSVEPTTDYVLPFTLYTFSNKEPVNNIGNTMNHGLFAYGDGAWYSSNVYYNEENDAHYRKTRVFQLFDWDKADEMIYLADVPTDGSRVSNMCVYQGKVYFRIYSWVEVWPLSAEDSPIGTVFSMNTDGSDLKRLTDEATNIFYIYNDHIYYQVTPIGSSDLINGVQIYRTALDGTEKELLFSDETSYFELFSIYDGRMYIPKGDKTLICVDLTTGEIFDASKELTASDMTQLFQVVPTEHGIYFMGNPGDGRGLSLYHMDLDGKNIKQIIPGQIEFTISDDWIYYYGGFDSGYAIRKRKCDGIEDILISEIEHTPENLAVINDTIFFEVWHLALYRMPINGSESQTKIN